MQFKFLIFPLYEIYSLGSARAVNRRYISDCVPLKIRMQASAGFVSASALGMACGPALAGLLQTNFKIYKLTINQDTLPGWVMALAWLVYLIWLWISFREPSHETYENHAAQESTAGMATMPHSCSDLFLNPKNVLFSLLITISFFLKIILLTC